MLGMIHGLLLTALRRAVVVRPHLCRFALRHIWDVMLVSRRRILKKLSSCYSIVYYSNGAQTYGQFLQVGRLYRVSILLDLALCLPSASVSLVFMVLYTYLKKILLTVHPFLYLLVSWAWWDWPLTWLTDHHPSVLLHCWLGHVTRKIVPEMTCNVSSGTLNPTIPLQDVSETVCDEVCPLPVSIVWLPQKPHFSQMFTAEHQ